MSETERESSHSPRYDPFSPGGRSPEVLYVKCGQEDDTGVASELEDEHGLAVHIAPSVQRAVARLENDSDAVDCLVIDTGEEPPDGTLVSEARAQQSALPLIVYATAECNSERCREYLDAGASDVVSKASDTASGRLLANRIERCVALERERTRVEHLQTTIDRMGHGVLVADPDGRIEYVNQAFETLGYTRETLEESTLIELRSDAHDKRFYDEFWETLTAGNSWSGELTLSGENGETYPVNLTATPIRDTDDEIRRIVVVGDEISGREQYERRLEVARQKYRALIDSAPDAVIVADDETGEIVEANEAAADLFGRPQQDMVGMDQTELNPTEHRDQYRELFDRHRRTAQAVFDRFDTGDPIDVVTTDGDRIPVEINAKVVELNDRTLVQGHFRDITERKERERTLRGFREAVEQAGHVIMITDTDGTVEYVNPAFEAVTGYSEAEVLGECPSLLNSGEQDEEFYRDFWETITSGDIWQGELVNERKNGERYYIEQTVAPITDEDGEIERFVAVNQEITERKEYETQLERERDRLEEFAGTVAHDLRNPLTIALGHVDLAYQNQPTDEVATLLETAITAMERMETVIDEVLALSEQGETIQEPETIEFGDVVDEAWNMTETSSATLSRDDDVDEWSLLADESRLCELLENLFGNAVEHAGPDVAVRVGTLADGRGFFVEDDGPGLPPINYNRIFESGFTTETDGTGFGLAIVKQIVEAHGWEISATDAAAETTGARFEVTTESR